MPRRICASLLALVLVALAACSDDGGGADAALEREPAPTTTEAPTTTTTAPTTTTTAPPPARPVAADDPAGLAEQLIAAEQGLRAEPPRPETWPALGHLQQVAYRKLADNPDWDAEVAARLPAELRPVVAANTAAGRELRRLVRTPRAELPAWRIVEPAPAEQLRQWYEEVEATFGVPWEYVAAINLTETRMGRLRGTSTAGAQGPMQFLPSTWAAYGAGGDIHDDHDAILGAGRYLAANGGDCRPGAPCDLANALYRYNPTPKYVNAVTAYAQQMEADERAFRGYYHWQVYYLTTLGDAWLPVGYEATETRPVTPADVA